MTTPSKQAEEEELDRALEEGSGARMHDNVAPGLLGERPVDLRKVDRFQYEENAGMVQENTGMVRWLFIVILYLLVVTVPIALWLLWRDKQWSTTKKTVATLVMALGYAAIAWRVFL